VNRFLATFLCGGLLCAVYGWPGLAQSLPTPPKPETDDSKTPAPTMPKAIEGTIAPVQTDKYLLGPEDVIFIKTWREVDFTFVTAIRPDGKITLPLYGDIQAADLTPKQLGLDIKEALTKYINSPDVQVFVQDVRSKKYFVDGQVSRTGPFPLITKTTVLEALSACQPFKEFANTKKIRILRGQKVFYFNWNQVSNGKHMEQNIDLENGDHVIVR
jgi:polysaccharide biosynthesis/export protein